MQYVAPRIDRTNDRKTPFSLIFPSLQAWLAGYDNTDRVNMTLYDKYFAFVLNNLDEFVLKQCFCVFIIPNSLSFVLKTYENEYV